MPVLDTFNLPRQRFCRGKVGLSNCRANITAYRLRDTAICAIFFFEIAAAKSRLQWKTNPRPPGTLYIQLHKNMRNGRCIYELIIIVKMECRPKQKSVNLLSVYRN